MRKPLLSALLSLLLVPVTGPAPVRADGTVWHVVRPGESLAYIAALTNVSAGDLADWNGLPPGSTAQVDSVMRLNPPDAPLPAFRTRVEPVTPGMVNWNPLKRCPVLPINLRKVWVSYIDFTGAYHDGSVIVRKDVTARTQQIFGILYRTRFRIMGMAPMAVNNPTEKNMATVTAGYNCRAVGGTTAWSEHALGIAIDINPFQNPMIRGRSISPAGSAFYLDRSRYLIGMVHPEGAARAFLGNDFFWGGTWSSLKDYMHFSLTNK
ncbi:M15 family metallopeptidase [Actinoplanes bogorensis]|uniref:M15 family metallopeptidase n=1 Tax=Paractinoplanes bogorensis TaxID=1610840 RepID=A0ABS5Z0G7_9ACTN|nr:M15 family metallopeptidase [Actinoplanes bogorensis]MBU2669143.1 M15 family metallopeptidase [Actinoplanes bogorensis]